MDSQIRHNAEGTSGNGKWLIQERITSIMKKSGRETVGKLKLLLGEKVSSMNSWADVVHEDVFFYNTRGTAKLSKGVLQAHADVFRKIVGGITAHMNAGS